MTATVDEQFDPSDHTHLNQSEMMAKFREGAWTSDQYHDVQVLKQIEEFQRWERATSQKIGEIRNRSRRTFRKFRSF